MAQPKAAHTITISQANDDLQVLTNDKEAFEEIMEWYMDTARREVIPLKAPSKFVRFHGILEGAEKDSIFGKVDGLSLWHIPITDHLLKMEYKLIATTALRSDVDEFEKKSGTFHTLVFAKM